MLTLILGGVRSGKSRLAEQLALATDLSVTYLATARADDTEMRARIDAHRARRPQTWKVVEEPLALGMVLDSQREGECILVDCLTLWLTNLLLAEPEAFARERQSFLHALGRPKGDVILVSNETNLGVIPADALARRFCDEAGILHQELAQRCDRVILTVAGLPQILKGAPVWPPP